MKTEMQQKNKRNTVKKDLNNLTLNLKKLKKNKLIQSYQKEIINITGEITKQRIGKQTQINVTQSQFFEENKG